MDHTSHTPPLCLLLTATITVKRDLVFTERKDTNTRLEDYKVALSLWLQEKDVHEVVFVENSGSDLSELRAIAAKYTSKTVEFLSFTMADFDSRLGKGLGEMACLQYAAESSQLLARNPRFVKVTGRYFIDNAREFLQFAKMRSDSDVVCDMLSNMTWADSRAFAATTNFVLTYLLPFASELNDSTGTNFEHVLARAVHATMAHCGVWAQPPFPIVIRGISGSQNRGWKRGPIAMLKTRLRHALFARTLRTGPQ